MRSPTVPKQIYLDWADLLGRAGNYHGAFAKYAEVLAVDSTYADADNAWGMMLLARAYAGAAIGKFERAIRYAPSRPLFYVHLGNALDAVGLYDEAIERYRQAVQLQPMSALAYYYWGRAEIARDDRDAARDAFRRGSESLRRLYGVWCACDWLPPEPGGVEWKGAVIGEYGIAEALSNEPILPRWLILAEPDHDDGRCLADWARLTLGLR